MLNRFNLSAREQLLFNLGYKFAALGEMPHLELRDDIEEALLGKLDRIINDDLTPEELEERSKARDSLNLDLINCEDLEYFDHAEEEFRVFDYSDLLELYGLD
jgi:hypothetical protein